MPPGQVRACQNGRAEKRTGPVCDGAVLSVAAAFPGEGISLRAVDLPARVPDLLARRAAEAPAAVAVMVDGARELTYGDWDRRSDAAAAGLEAWGVGRGAVVALWFDSAHFDDYAVAYLAVHKAGAAAVPLGPGVAGPDPGKVLVHCGAVGVIGPAALRLPPAPPGVWRYALPDLEAGGGRAAGGGPAPDDLAEIIYTSGTTGTPKGVACSHASIMFHDEALGAEGATVTMLHAFPVGTNAAQEALRITLRRGDRRVVALSRFEPELACTLIERLGVSRLQLVPAMAQFLLASGAWRHHDLSSVRVVTLSSAPSPPAMLHRLAEAFPQARLANAYSLTESGTARTLNLDALADPDSVGRPVGLTEVRVVDGEGNPAPPGEPGEVWLRRPGAPLREYFRDPDATRAAFAGGWLHTGDIGALDAGGALHLLDRAKDIVISGGLNVSTLEVEDALYEHPAVVEAAVVGVPHPVLGQDVAAAVVVSSAVEPRELQSFVRRRLAEHKVPHRVAIMDRLPHTASGKVRKRDLLGPLAPAPAGDPAAAPGAGTSPTEEALAAIWAEVLGVEDVGPHDDFFDLGGQSLAAAGILARVQEAFGVDLAVSVLFDHPTVAELAAAIAGAGSAVSWSTVPGPERS